MTKLHSSTAEKAKWLSMRSRPKALTMGELNQRSAARQAQAERIGKMRMEMAKATKEGDRDRRAKASQATIDAFARGVQKNAELGIDPIYLNLPYDRRAALRAAWKKQSKAWDIAHQPLPDLASA